MPGQDDCTSLDLALQLREQAPELRVQFLVDGVQVVARVMDDDAQDVRNALSSNRAVRCQRLDVPVSSPSGSRPASSPRDVDPSSTPGP